MAELVLGCVSLTWTMSGLQNTGTVFQVAERLQGNLFVNNETFKVENTTFSWYPNLPPTYLPMFWIDKNGST